MNLVEKLRDIHAVGRVEDCAHSTDVCEEAANEIERLIKERDELLSALIEARQALQFANDAPGGGINDTIWMMHRSETLFDFVDSAIENANLK